MNPETLDYTQFEDITSKIKTNKAGDIASGVLQLPKTKVYLVNEFDLQGYKEIVVIVKWFDTVSNEFDYIMCLWDKEKAIGK